MPEQMREALESAGVEPVQENRREAMERAFDNLQGEGEESVSGGDAPGYGKKAESDGKEPVVKWSGEKPKPGEHKPIAKEQPLKPLAKGAKPAPQAGKPGAKPGTPDQGEQPVAKANKAPVSWKPEEREHWDKMSPQAQAAVMRREGEISKALNETASARRFGGEFYNIIKPFEHLIRASGVSPLQAVDNLVKTAGGLQTGTAMQKAQIVANIVAAYGVDLRVLDHVLAGKTPPKEAGANDEIMKAIDARLKPVQEFIGEVRGARSASEQRMLQETASEAETFAQDPKNEFFEDLRGDIADLLDLAANRGRAMTLEEAYKLAAAQHPEISKVIKERESAAETARRAQNFDRSRRAASSQPAGNPSGGIGGRSSRQAGESRRDALGRAWDDLST